MNAQNTSIVTLHHSCKTLPLAAFIEAACNNDYTGLIISGEPTEVQLLDAWSEILFDYASLIKSENSELLFDLSKQIGLNKHHLIYVGNALFYLRIKHDQDLIDELRAMGYTLSDHPGEAELNMIDTLSARMLFDLDELTEEYNRLTKTVTGKKQTEEEFDKTIAALAKFIGYRIDRAVTMMNEFVGILNLYLAQAASDKNRNNNA